MILTTLLLASCIPPSTYGLRFDGSMAENSEIAAVGGYYPDLSASGDSTLDASILGIQGRQRIGNDVTASLSVGAAPGSGNSAPYLGGELEVQGRVVNDKPVTIGLTGGLSVIGNPDAESLGLISGFSVGTVVSRGLPADLRPFIAAKLNPVFGGATLYPWVTTGGGLTWRPVIAQGTRGLLGLEAFYMHGFNADLSAKQAADISTWGGMIQVGASFGNERLR